MVNQPERGHKTLQHYQHRLLEPFFWCSLHRRIPIYANSWTEWFSTDLLEPFLHLTSKAGSTSKALYYCSSKLLTFGSYSWQSLVALRAYMTITIVPLSVLIFLYKHRWLVAWQPACNTLNLIESNFTPNFQKQIYNVQRPETVDKNIFL